MLKTKIFSATILIGLLLNFQFFTKNILAVDPTPTLTTTPTVTLTTTPTITPTATPTLTTTPTITTAPSTSSSLPAAGGLTPTIFLLLAASSFIGFSFLSLNKK